MRKCGIARQATEGTARVMRHICSACWVTKATDTQSEYVILIASKRHPNFGKRASILLSQYTACLFYLKQGE